MGQNNGSGRTVLFSKSFTSYTDKIIISLAFTICALRQGTWYSMNNVYSGEIVLYCRRFSINVVIRFVMPVGVSAKSLLFYCNTLPASVLIEQKKMTF